MSCETPAGGDTRPSPQICRVLLCGAQSTGKSTLMGDVMKHLDVAHGGEVGRSIMVENGWTAESIDPQHHPQVFEDLQRQVLSRQRDIDQSFIQSGQSYMSDRSVDPFVYAAVYLGEDAKDRLVQSELGQYCLDRVKKSLVFLVTPHREIARDDSVRMYADFDRMLQYTDVMRKLLTQQNVRFEEVTVLDRAKRVEQVLGKIRQEWPGLIKKERSHLEKTESG